MSDLSVDAVLADGTVEVAVQRFSNSGSSTRNTVNRVPDRPVVRTVIPVQPISLFSRPTRTSAWTLDAQLHQLVKNGGPARVFCSAQELGSEIFEPLTFFNAHGDNRESQQQLCHGYLS